VPDYSGISRRGWEWQYQQLAKALEDAIRSGEYAPGSMLPAELAIAQDAGVSRHTVRHALSSLRDRGLVLSRERRGWFAASPLPPPGP
jgi:GntR family transcriptional regulator